MSVIAVSPGSPIRREVSAGTGQRGGSSFELPFIDAAESSEKELAKLR
jgi:hypothetical protein